ncbi:MAG: thioredoxin family protein [Bacteroidales bacterium]|nr:thioredoxin family protein [Bacteroidales bacterium]
MKQVLIIVFILFSFSIKAQDTLLIASEPSDSILYNQVILDTNIDKSILIGYCTQNGISSSPVFNSYYKQEYNTYIPNLDFLETLKDELYTVRITIVFGSWCSDSQREVPRLLRILDELNFPLDSLTIIGVNRLKTAPGINISHSMIEFVPTIIFYRNNFEIGRIVESPFETLEDDMASLLMKSSNE